jgi:hypothetical protein
MKNLTTPKAILYGFLLVAVSITTLPYSPKLISLAHAEFTNRDTTIMDRGFSGITNAIRNISACRN